MNNNDYIECYCDAICLEFNDCCDDFTEVYVLDRCCVLEELSTDTSNLYNEQMWPNPTKPTTLTTISTSYLCRQVWC